MRSRSTDNLWNKGFHFGDWLFYRPNDDNSGRAAVTDKYLIAQCFYAHSTELLVKAAKVLGKTQEALTYSELLEKIKAAYQKEYLTPNGRLVSSTQTAYVLALQFDMLPENLRQQAADRLVENIKSYNNHLTTGFLGTPYLCHVLVSLKVANDATFEAYNWSLYSVNGKKIGEIRDYRSYAPFYVTPSNVLIYEVGPYLRNVKGKMIETPLQLVAIDLISGKKLWDTPIFDPVYRGPTPP